ncbi:MAG: T9SS type A sorting domain-containing protein [Bacteroidales bacterium]|nr:T9SS type A sorting domain-containing protein [Bacteroidales bacterium]
MKRLAISALLLLAAGSLWAQQPLKPRPDAFPPAPEAIGSKAVTMAALVDEMAAWDRYPTYETYLAMMQRWAERYPDLCTIDTIGTSVRGRLILAAHIEGNRSLDLYRPQFFYSSTIHGDEVTGYVMMLRLIDTLLASYGTSQRLTDLVDETAIYINPLANPDGAYWQGNQSVQGSMRYNANWVDLNRNYPDPFGGAKAAVEQENEAMIDYFTAHRFRLSANLHGGSEVMNYPWDCFTSLQNPHPQAGWWKGVCKRFVDTVRTYNNTLFRDVVSSGIIAGGDWYVIHGGRQDYVNYYHDCLEVTMEVSTVKTLSSDLLPAYWNALGHSFINYIAEVHNLPEGVGIADGQPSATGARLAVYPNPATGQVTVQGLEPDAEVCILDLGGRCLYRGTGPTLDLSALPAGVYTLQAGGRSTRIIKK